MEVVTMTTSIRTTEELKHSHCPQGRRGEVKMTIIMMKSVKKTRKSFFLLPLEAWFL